MSSFVGRSHNRQHIDVKDGDEVIDPLGVDVAVENDPLQLVQLATNVVYDLPGYHGSRIIE